MKSERKRIVIVGASAAGLRCACRLARLKPDWQITLVEARRKFSFAACGLPYALSGDIDDFDALRRTDDGALRDVDYFRNIKGFEVLCGQRAVSIDVTGHKLATSGSHGANILAWDELVLATGSRPQTLPGQPSHPRVRPFHSLDDLEALHAGLAGRKIQRVVVIGAGLVGCELAEAFSVMWGAEVTLIEAASDPLSGLLDAELAGIVKREIEKNDVQFFPGCAVESITAGDAGASVSIGDREFRGDAIVVAVGVVPATALARTAEVALGPKGAILVDDRLATSIDHIWAIGDCVLSRNSVTADNSFLPLGSLANRQGRTLANILAGREERFPAIAGAVAVKVFDCNVAAVGLTREQALQCGIRARSVWVHSHDSAHYWPAAKEIALQLTYEQESLRILGMQAAGEGEVAKRVDLACLFIAKGASIEDLAQLEHAYAPPYAPAIDPLATTAFVAANQEEGVESISPLADLSAACVIDVRHSFEIEARPLNAHSLKIIPLEEIRQRFTEIDGADNVVVCERGTRAAEAVRWLRGKGMFLRFLGGGLRFRELAGGGF
ncbi:MAG TPA: FAD-dependent oxidoreductase [Myxococcota bacterium]|nr:FAD-dependent oxidoreductase [Myxococcota bacterium]